MDSAIHRSNNCCLVFKCLTFFFRRNHGPESTRVWMLCKGYRPEAWGYVIYSPRALPLGNEGNKSHNHELKANKQLIFTLARIPQGMQKYIDEKCCYCSSFFCFLTLHAGTGGIHKFLGFLIMLVFQSRIWN